MTNSNNNTHRKKKRRSKGEGELRKQKERCTALRKEKERWTKLRKEKEVRTKLRCLNNAKKRKGYVDNIKNRLNGQKGKDLVPVLMFNSQHIPAELTNNTQTVCGDDRVAGDQEHQQPHEGIDGTRTLKGTTLIHNEQRSRTERTRTATTVIETYNNNIDSNE